MALVLATGFAGVNRSAAADSPRARLTVTVRIHNNAEVDDKMLAEAEKVAMEIFRKAGVESRWVDDALTSENNNETLAHQGAFPLSHIWVSIYTGSMADRFGLPSKVMGFTPGTERNRQLVYVFYNRVEALAQSQLRARFEGSGRRPATTAQILGHVIAHELGHVLLNIASHSATGLMRGGWNLKDLQNAAYGCLLFTSQQAEVIRTEVFRRVTDSKMP
ncbi:MAG: hypothetical protein LAO08_16990 [Acidobacteriia bacterium]|nr:hypothetical protein [Terriglobia bacterium]